MKMAKQAVNFEEPKIRSVRLLIRIKRFDTADDYTAVTAQTINNERETIIGVAEVPKGQRISSTADWETFKKEVNIHAYDVWWLPERLEQENEMQ